MTQPNPMEASVNLAGDLRSRLALSQSMHEEAAKQFAWRFQAISVTSVCLAASAGVIEAAIPNVYAKKLALISVSAFNTVLLTVANMKGYQSLKDRHAEAAQTYASIVSELDYKVIFPCRNHSWYGSTEKLDETLNDLAANIRDLAHKAPPVVLSVEPPGPTRGFRFTL